MSFIHEHQPLTLKNTPKNAVQAGQASTRAGNEGKQASFCVTSASHDAEADDCGWASWLRERRPTEVLGEFQLG
jgi:hypothetical protein